jgi:hypothetical protein
MFRTGSTTLNNKYRPGSGGVGASNISNRRAKNRLATLCNGEASRCEAFYNVLGLYNTLGLYARNPNGYVPYSSRPSAPTLTSLTPSTGELTLNFTLGSDGGSAITDIEYSTDNGTTWTSSGQTTSPFVITGLANGTTYQVKVRAKNVVGTGPASNMVSGTLIAVAPSAPTLNTLTPSTGQLTLNFTLGSDGGSVITDIEYSTNNGTTWSSSGQTTSPFTVTGLANGTTYQVKVRAKNAVGTGASSNMVSGTLIAVAPSAPTLNTLIETNSQLRLNFTLGSNGGSAITDIEYSIDNGTTWISSGQTTSPFNVTGLANGTTYQVKVRAKNAVGPGEPSNMVPGTPRQIIIYSAVQTTTWVAPAGVTLVEYLVVGGGGGSGGAFDNAGGGGGGGGMVLTDTLLVTPGTSYNVVVGDGGEGGISIRDPVSQTNGTSGINSIFGSITALGGGGGYASRTAAAPGGAGLGGDKVSGSATSSTGGNGGAGGSGGGGGGGNATDGNNRSGTSGGDGGAGVAVSISGSPVTYGAGGDGANSGGLNVSVAGATNTGNGARAAGVASTAQTNGAKGGSGIVIIKF